MNEEPGFYFIALLGLYMLAGVGISIFLAMTYKMFGPPPMGRGGDQSTRRPGPPPAGGME